MKAGLLLAAGLSRRYGATDKLTEIREGAPLVTHAAATLRSLPLDRLIAVTSSADVSALLDGFRIVRNPAPERGMGTSLALGAAAARELGASRLLVLLADMPHVTASHGAAVLAACTDKHASASLCDGVRMPPACFPAADFTRLAALSGDHGARDLIADLPADALVEAGPALFTDIDMPETGGPA